MLRGATGPGCENAICECAKRVGTPVVLMPTALVIMPAIPVVTGVVFRRACAALSNIGLTSEENPRKNKKSKPIGKAATRRWPYRQGLLTGRAGFGFIYEAPGTEISQNGTFPITTRMTLR